MKTAKEEISMRVSALCSEVGDELTKAISRHRKMNSPHEGYAVIKEELEELWEEVKRQQPVAGRLRAEALQVAAMGLRFILDLCDG